eukprot:TRINITY_DN8623_c0_g1_i1.p1 TRINITY_DN8623_c0_g1~~TRINITY_DN8623_c0_g1_i1.p1  ORF type:complete len:116 (+),score=22.94 TRINITY_DN8623_c0_g1_i1:29-376(+)
MMRSTHGPLAMVLLALSCVSMAEHEDLAETTGELTTSRKCVSLLADMGDRVKALQKAMHQSECELRLQMAQARLDPTGVLKLGDKLLTMEEAHKILKRTLRTRCAHFDESSGRLG